MENASNFYEFDLYGNLIGIKHSEKSNDNYQSFLSEEGIPIKNKLIGLTEKRYDEICDNTADRIFIVSIKSTDESFKELIRFSSIEDIMRHFNDGKSDILDYSDDDWINRCDIVKSIRDNITFFRNKMIVSKLSKFPKNMRKSKIIFNLINDPMFGPNIEYLN